MSGIRMCIDKWPAPSQSRDLDKIARRETRHNAGPLRTALLMSKGWSIGRILRVCFLDGPSAVHDRIQEIAPRWSLYANIKFAFGTDPDAEIRVSCAEPDVSWSLLGTDALDCPKGQPTMNYGWLTPTTPFEECERVVLHEFGHALGLIHEHQHPDAGIPWNKDAVYSFFQRLGWTKADVDHNLFQRYDRDSLRCSYYDRDSIMHYPVDPNLTIDGWQQGWNQDLSPVDRAFATLIYPPINEPAPASDQLVVNATPVAADTSRLAPFRIEIEQSALYNLETSGSTDVRMELRSTTGALIATDDNGAGDKNARMLIDLEPGSYLLYVRGSKSCDQGPYEIRLETVS